MGWDRDGGGGGGGNGAAIYIWKCLLTIFRTSQTSMCLWRAEKWKSNKLFVFICQWDGETVGKVGLLLYYIYRHFSSAFAFTDCNTVAFTNRRTVSAPPQTWCQCVCARVCTLSWRKHTCRSRHKTSHRAYVQIQKLKSGFFFRITLSPVFLCRTCTSFVSVFLTAFVLYRHCFLLGCRLLLMLLPLNADRTAENRRRQWSRCFSARLRYFYVRCAFIVHIVTKFSSHQSHRGADDGIACERTHTHTHTNGGAACINIMVSLLFVHVYLLVLSTTTHRHTSDACTQRTTKLANKTLEIIMLAVCGA